MSEHSRRNLIKHAGVGSAALLSGCSALTEGLSGGNGGAQDLPDETLTNAKFFIRDTGDIDFVLSFESEISKRGIDGNDLLITESNVIIDDNVSFDWIEGTGVSEDQLRRLESKSDGRFDAGRHLSIWTEGPEPEYRVASGSQKIAGTISSAIPVIDQVRDFGSREIELPEIGFRGQIKGSSDTVQVRLPDGQTISSPYRIPEENNSEIILDGEGENGKFSLDFKEEKVKYKKSGTEWEYTFPTDIPSESLLTASDSESEYTILVQNRLIALNPGYAALRSIWRTHYQFYNMVDRITTNVEEEAVDVLSGSRNIIRESLGWMAPVDPNPTRQYAIVGTQTAVALQLSVNAARATGAIFDTLLTAKDIYEGSERVLDMAEDVGESIGDMIKGFEQEGTRTGVAPQLHRFVAEKVVVALSARKLDKTHSKFQRLLNTIGNEYKDLSMPSHYPGSVPSDAPYSVTDWDDVHKAVIKRNNMLSGTPDSVGIFNRAIKNKKANSTTTVSKFQFDAANSGFSSNLRGPANAFKPRVEWSYEGEDCDVMPVFDSEYAYVCIENNFIALDPASGEEVWNLKIDAGNITTTPTISDDLVYLGTDEPGITSIDLNDKKEAAIETNVFSGGVISPSLVDGNIITATGNNGRKIYKLDQNGVVDDNSLAYYNGPSAERSTAAIDDSHIYVSGRNRLQAFTIGELEEEWTKEIGYTNALPSVDPSAGIVYSPEEHNLIARDAATGQEYWRSTTDDEFWNSLYDEGSTFQIPTIVSTPTVTEDFVYVNGATPHQILAYERGVSAKTPRKPTHIHQLESKPIAEPIATSTRLYVATERKFLCLDRNSFELNWSVDEDDVEGEFKTAPVPNGYRVYVGTSNGIIALE